MTKAAKWKMPEDWTVDGCVAVFREFKDSFWEFRHRYNVKKFHIERVSDGEWSKEVITGKIRKRAQGVFTPAEWTQPDSHAIEMNVNSFIKRLDSVGVKRVRLGDGLRQVPYKFLWFEWTSEEECWRLEFVYEAEVENLLKEANLLEEVRE